MSTIHAASDGFFGDSKLHDAKRKVHLMHKELVYLRAQQESLLRVAKAARLFSNKVRGWSTISINNVRFGVVDEELKEAIKEIEHLLVEVNDENER